MREGSAFMTLNSVMYYVEKY